MAKARKPLVGHPRVVSRPAELGPWVSEMGRSKRQCTCPWCDEVFSLFVRSLNGGGKRCPGCKAKVDPSGDAHHYANYKHRRDKMRNPDWTEAPDQATHYDRIADLFCTVNGWWHKNEYVPVENKDWGTDRYTPRPTTQERQHD